MDNERARFEAVDFIKIPDGIFWSDEMECYTTTEREMLPDMDRLNELFDIWKEAISIDIANYKADLLPEEIEFVKRVCMYPGSKLNDFPCLIIIDDGTEWGESYALWEKPEALGLIECVGGYKWIPTDKIELTWSIRQSAKEE